MVQTFLISHIFSKTAKILDNKRLGKQRVETLQIINIIDGETEKKGFSKHPAVRSWYGYSDALKKYCNVMLEEWEKRGFKNNIEYYNIPKNIKYPKWIYNEKIHMSHKARLVQKDYNNYSSIFPEVLNTEYMNRGYIWPSKWTEEQLEKLSIVELTEKKPVEEICNKCNYKASMPTCKGWMCKIHAKGLELVENKCIAIKKNGSLCQNKKKNGDYCGVHKKLIEYDKDI